MKLIRLIIYVVLGFIAANAFGQNGLYSTLNTLFDANNTNSIMRASEINITPLFLWDAEKERMGGALDLNWWVTDQQGMVLRYTQFEDRSEYWSLGYKARAMFKGMELGIGTGVTQNRVETLGDVKAYIQPSVSYKLPMDKIDARVYAMAEIYHTERAIVGFGFSFRFAK